MRPTPYENTGNEHAKHHCRERKKLAEKQRSGRSIKND